MEQSSQGSQQSEERFDAILKELTKIKDDYVVRAKEWYKKHAWPQMIYFRASSVLVIFLSVSIPFLVLLGGFWKETVLSLAALMIAGLTGLISFFKWEKKWDGHRQTQFTLEYLLIIWELKIVEAKSYEDRDKRIEMAIIATEELINKARLVTSAESEDFFKRIQPPQIKQSQ